jgi:hypothetical protein
MAYSELEAVQVYLASLEREATKTAECIASAIEMAYPAWLAAREIGDVSVAGWGACKTSDQDIEQLREHLQVAFRELRAAERIADIAVEDLSHVVRVLSD